MPHAPVLTVTLIMGDNYFNADMDYRIARENHRESTNMSQKRWTVLQELSMLSSSPIQDIINNFTVLAEIQPNPAPCRGQGCIFYLFPLGAFHPLLRGNGSAAPSNYHRSYFLPSLPATLHSSFSAPDRI